MKSNLRSEIIEKMVGIKSGMTPAEIAELLPASDPKKVVKAVANMASDGKLDKHPIEGTNRFTYTLSVNHVPDGEMKPARKPQKPKKKPAVKQQRIEPASLLPAITFEGELMVIDPEMQQVVSHYTVADTAAIADVIFKHFEP